MSCRVRVVLNLDLRLWGVVDHSTTRTRGSTTPKPAPRGIGGGARREASIEGVRFRCKLQADSRLHSLLTHRNLPHAGRRLKRAFRFRKVLWLLSSKESNNKKNLCSNTALCLRHGMDRDAPGKKEPAPRGIGGCVRREASIEGVRFRCKA
jgi:hypothetical protein